MTNDLNQLRGLFSTFEPFEGHVPQGLLVDFTGQLTKAAFRAMWGVDPEKVGGGHVKMAPPDISLGEGYFEAVDSFIAASEARGRFTMATLGACYGAQAVQSYLMLKKINPMPAKLVLVEGDPESLEWTRQHLALNQISVSEHWLLQAAISDTNEPVLFPVGAPGSGTQNCIATNHADSRRIYATEMLRRPDRDRILESIILHNNTTVKRELHKGRDFWGELRFVSAVTLNDILSPFDFVDYLESDIQQSEITVFPPCMDLLRRKVRRVHIGTHGKDVHDELVRLFARDGWEIVFDFAPASAFETAFGSFTTSDGILTARNPNF